ncbi:MAG: GTPase Era, partial [Xanthomonadales bacterium]|nr:GTPase Era [Xanthomonadales bacterium]
MSNEATRDAPRTEDSRFGYAALVGRPNVGKSTLMNRILGQKLSIVTAKPQTTRQQVAGIKTTEKGQVVYIDTPGIHLAAKKALNRYMNRIAQAAFQDVDLVLFLIEAGRWTRQDENVARSLKKVDVPVFLVVNKIDLLPDKRELLTFLDREVRIGRFSEVLLIAAKNGDGVDDLENRVMEELPFSRPFYDEDQFTNRSERFLAAELVREQLMLRLHKEIPYALTVEIESFKREDGLVRIG